MRVALFGGSFNPPHVSHMLAVSYVLSMGIVDRVLVVPVYAHAFEKRLTSFEHRLELCDRAMGWLPGVEICPIERELEPPSYTLHTIQRLAREHPDWRFRLVVGSDVLGESEKWHAFDEVVRLAPLFPLGRLGAPHPDAPPALLPDVSSTRVREWLSRGDAAADAELGRWVPARVLDYIRENGLYR